MGSPTHKKWVVFHIFKSFFSRHNFTYPINICSLNYLLMKVLIVADNPEVRQMIKRFIQDIADEIVECADGDDILTAYKLFRPDWVLLDIELKRLGGFVVGKKIMKSFPNASIVFLASFDDANLRIIAQEIGAKGFVLKENLASLREILAERV